MTRYLVFKFSHYDESGGWNDFSSAHSELKQAVNAAEKHDGNSYAQIVDLEELKVVDERLYCEDVHMMVTEVEFKKLQHQREETIAELQRARGLIA